MPISDFGDPILGGASGLYGAFIITPAGSTFHDPSTGVARKSGVVVDVRNPNLPGGGYRDVALLFHDEDHTMNRDVMPYRIDVRGNRGINYKAEPFVERLALDSAKSRVFTSENVSGHGDPRTTLIQVTQGDPVQLHIIGSFGNHPHIFSMDGHRFPFDVSRPNAMNLPARAFGALDHIDAMLEGGAGAAGRGRGLPVRRPSQPVPGSWTVGHHASHAKIGHNGSAADESRPRVEPGITQRPDREYHGEPVPDINLRQV